MYFDNGQRDRARRIELARKIESEGQCYRIFNYHFLIALVLYATYKGDVHFYLWQRLAEMNHAHVAVAKSTKSVASTNH